MQFDNKECVRCVMGTRWDRSIEFDNNGVCNHCIRFNDLVDSRVFSGNEGTQKLNDVKPSIEIVSKIREYEKII